MNLRDETRETLRMHRVVAVSFARAVVDCECGAEIRTDLAGAERLAEAYQRHRTAAGVPRTSVGSTIGKRLGTTGEASEWNARRP